MLIPSDHVLKCPQIICFIFKSGGIPKATLIGLEVGMWPKPDESESMEKALPELFRTIYSSLHWTIFLLNLEDINLGYLHDHMNRTYLRKKSTQRQAGKQGRQLLTHDIFLAPWFRCVWKTEIHLDFSVTGANNSFILAKPLTFFYFCRCFAFCFSTLFFSLKYSCYTI